MSCTLFHCGCHRALSCAYPPPCRWGIQVCDCKSATSSRRSSDGSSRRRSGGKICESRSISDVRVVTGGAGGLNGAACTAGCYYSANDERATGTNDFPRRRGYCGTDATAMCGDTWNWQDKENDPVCPLDGQVLPAGSSSISLFVYHSIPYEPYAPLPRNRSCLQATRRGKTSWTIHKAR